MNTISAAFDSMILAQISLPLIDCSALAEERIGRLNHALVIKVYVDALKLHSSSGGGGWYQPFVPAAGAPKP